VTPAQIEAYVDAAAAALALPLAAAHRPGVLHYFALAAQMAQRLDQEPVQPHDESAEVFVPVAPRAPHGA
jgi:hypothetical protein